MKRLGIFFITSITYMKNITKLLLAVGAAFVLGGAVYAAEIPSPRVEILDPIAGEVWQVGSTQRIEWIGIELNGPYSVEIQRGNGPWQMIVPAVEESYYDWQVTGWPFRQVRVRVTDVDTPGDAGISEDFSVAGGSVQPR